MGRAALFDLDGLLVDSLAATATYYRRLFELSGRRAPDRSAFVPLVHMTLVDTLRSLLPEDADAVAELVGLVEVLEYPVDEVRLMPCAREVLLGARQQDWLLGLVTSRISRDTTHILNHFGFHFDVVLAIEDYVVPKPAPDGLVMAAQRLGVEPGRSIYVGDASSDVAAANEAGLWSIRVGPARDSSADVCLSTLCELPSALADLVSRL